MHTSFIISTVLVISIITVLRFFERRGKEIFSIEILPFNYKYVGALLVIISIFLSFFESMGDEPFNNIRILIANLGLIVITLSKDKIKLNNSNLFKLACFTLSTITFYLVKQLMVLFFGGEETIELSWFVFDLLVIYLISYHYFKFKLPKSE